MSDTQLSKKSMLLIKQNTLKNITVLLCTIVFTLWVLPYTEEVGESGVDAFLFLSIFPLGAMFAYFAFSYSSTNLDSARHRALADISTFIFLMIISFSISMATIIGIFTIPALTFPFLALSVLLIVGCLVYDFWDLSSNLEK